MFLDGCFSIKASADSIINKRGEIKIFTLRALRIFSVWLLLVASDTAAQLLLKKGAVNSDFSRWKVDSLVIAGYSLYILSFIAWMQILKSTRLFVALSAASVLYITVAGASYLFMGEKITPHLIIGTVLIASGVFILSSGGKNNLAEKNNPAGEKNGVL